MSIALMERRGEISHTYARVRTYLARALTTLVFSHCGGDTLKWRLQICAAVIVLPSRKFGRNTLRSIAYNPRAQELRMLQETGSSMKHTIVNRQKI